MPKEDTSQPDGAASLADKTGADPFASVEPDKAIGNPNRKRRMSKRERKNLKKKRKKVDGSEGSDSAFNFNASVAPAKESTTDDKEEILVHSKSTTDGHDVQRSEPSLEEYMTNYTPAPSVKVAKEDDETQSKSLGKWFPKASVIKSTVCYTNDYLAKLAKEKKKAEKSKKQADAKIPIEPKASLVLFYQYVSPLWSQAKVSSFLTYINTLAKEHRTNIGGRLRVSTEGINATVSLYYNQQYGYQFPSQALVVTHPFLGISSIYKRFHTRSIIRGRTDP